MPGSNFTKSTGTAFAAAVVVVMTGQVALADKVEDAKALVDSFYSHLIGKRCLDSTFPVFA